MKASSSNSVFDLPSDLICKLIDQIEEMKNNKQQRNSVNSSCAIRENESNFKAMMKEELDEANKQAHRELIEKATNEQEVLLISQFRLLSDYGKRVILAQVSGAARLCSNDK